MRKSLLSSLMCVAVVATSSLGDTIHLKNGSVLKGKVTSFADDQFIVMLDTGSGRNLSKAMIFMGDVSRIEFDSSPVSADAAGPATQPAESSPRMINDTPQRETKTRGVPANETPVRSTQPPDPQPRETGPPETQPVPTTVREPEPIQQEKPAVTNPPPVTAPPASETAEGERLARKQLVAVKTMTVDVSSRKDWTSSGLIVKRQHYTGSGERPHVRA
jgi:sRNA-binding regulator protein Hfq